LSQVFVYSWEEVRKLSPNSPAMTSKQFKIITLLCKLERQATFLGIITELLEFVRCKFFGWERLHQFKIFQLANLSRIYIALCRMKGWTI
jgi:hypothetical protein